MITNIEIANVFEEMADLLELSGENAFRIRAYRNGAKAIRDHSEPIAKLVESDVDLTSIEGIGSTLADKSKVLIQTGRLPQIEKLRQEVPPTLRDIMQVPGMGAKKAMKLKAEKIRSELLSKESGFATQAILYSDDPGSASNGGELGWVEPGMMVPEFEQAAFSLPIGQISELVETQYGIHIIEVLEKKNEKVRVSHILIAAKPNADGISKAGKLADSIRNQILTKKISFQKAVEIYSDDKIFKSNGGVLINVKSKTRSPIFQVGEIDADIVNQINNMNPGDITPAQPYKTLDQKVGYRIVTLLSEIPPRKASLEVDYNKIKDIVHDNLRDKAMDNWIKFYRGYVFVKLSPEYEGCENLKIFKNELK